MKNFENLRGWISVILSGLGFGFVIGLIVLLSIKNPSGYGVLYFFCCLGLFIGTLIAYLINKKYGMSNWWNPPSYSSDLDHFQEKFIDKTKDQEFLNVLHDLSNKELIIALSYQYYDWFYETKQAAKNEIIKRRISYSEIEIYLRSDAHFIQKGNNCPRCNSNKIEIDSISEKVICKICGYNSNQDNPFSFINRLKKLFGYYDDRRAKFDEIKNFIEHKQNL